MRTRDRLAAALRDAGLDTLADRAATGEFDDYESPHAFPQVELVRELRALPIPREDLCLRVMDGEWDGTADEAEAWARSPEGQSAFAALLGGGGNRASRRRRL